MWFVTWCDDRFRSSFWICSQARSDWGLKLLHLWRHAILGTFLWLPGLVAFLQHQLPQVIQGRLPNDIPNFFGCWLLFDFYNTSHCRVNCYHPGWIVLWKHSVFWHGTEALVCDHHGPQHVGFFVTAVLRKPDRLPYIPCKSRLSQSYKVHMSNGRTNCNLFLVNLTCH